MVESIVDYEEHQREDYRGDHHQERRTLQLLPIGPGSLFDELYIALFKVVDNLSHLYI